jgi:anhydro-N-acetylmuramic acid kinase
MIVVGLLSGASVDAIEVTVCEINGAPPSLYTETLTSLSIPWPIELRKMVLQAWAPGMVDIADLCLLDVAVGEAFAAAALEGIAYAGYYPEQVDLIGVQGQTMRHEVREDGHVMASLQLGQAAIVTEWTGITTVSDFRQRDIAAGGQGAPLIGYVDWLLLRDPRRARAIQYLNDVASVIFLPPLSDTERQPVGFDIGPGMVLIDYARLRLEAQDMGGDNASEAAADDGLLAEMLANPYLKRKPPKTVGQFDFTPEVAAEIWQRGHRAGLSPECILETFTTFTVTCIVEAYEQYAPLPVEEMVLAGPGRRYPLLVRRLRQAFDSIGFVTHEDIGLDTDSKAAMAIAVLAYETWHNRPGSLPSLTGAQHAVPLGAIIPGANYQKLLKKTWQAQCP